MSKTDPSKLTKQEFNSLYPVRLLDHDPGWAAIFEDEKQRILENVDRHVLLEIEHFGSTSIPGIKSKPYIDLIIGIPNGRLFDEALIEQFEAIGYAHYEVPARDGIGAYMSFAKGYHADGRLDQIFHIHMCPLDHAMWEQIKFRDYLRTHPERASEYEALKMELARQYPNDRGSYVLGKTEFIHATLERIKG